FIAWGTLHGLYLCANHAWQWVDSRTGFADRMPRVITVPVATLMTFLLVVLAWVYFRADTIGAAHHVLAAMAGSAQETDWAHIFGTRSAITFAAYLVVSLVIVWVFPNAYEAIDFVENRLTVNGQEGRRIGVMLCASGAVITVCLVSASLLSTF